MLLSATLILLVTLTIIPMIIIGIYVYNDAKKRGMNTLLWTLIAILAPGFIGLIIYLIVRSDHPDLSCPKCSKPISEDFTVCPHCGTSLKEFCLKCNFPLNPGWLICPNCGQTLTQEQQSALTLKKKKKSDKGLVVVLISVIAIPLILCILLTGALFGMFTFNRALGVASETFIPDIEISSISDDVYEIKNWIQNCDNAGSGVYILEVSAEPNDETTNKYFLYINDEYYYVTPEIDTDNSSINFICSKDSECDIDFGYTLSYFECTTAKKCGAKVIIDGVNTNYDLETTNDFSVDEIFTEYSELTLDINISDAVSTVYTASWSLYSGDEVVLTESAGNADGTFLSGSTYFYYQFLDDDITGITFSLYDSDNNLLLESDTMSMSESSVWIANVHYNEFGRLTYTTDFKPEEY